VIISTLIFLAVAVGAGILAFGPADGAAAALAKAVFVAAVLLFLFSLAAGVFRDTLRALTSVEERRR